MTPNWPIETSQPPAENPDDKALMARYGDRHPPAPSTTTPESVEALRVETVYVAPPAAGDFLDDAFRRGWRLVCPPQTVRRFKHGYVEVALLIIMELRDPPAVSSDHGGPQAAIEDSERRHESDPL